MTKKKKPAQPVNNKPAQGQKQGPKKGNSNMKLNNKKENKKDKGCC